MTPLAAAVKAAVRELRDAAEWIDTIRRVAARKEFKGDEVDTLKIRADQMRSVADALERAASGTK